MVKICETCKVQKNGLIESMKFKTNLGYSKHLKSKQHLSNQQGVQLDITTWDFQICGSSKPEAIDINKFNKISEQLRMEIEELISQN